MPSIKEKFDATPWCRKLAQATGLFMLGMGAVTAGVVAGVCTAATVYAFTAEPVFSATVGTTVGIAVAGKVWDMFQHRRDQLSIYAATGEWHKEANLGSHPSRSP